MSLVSIKGISCSRVSSSDALNPAENTPRCNPYIDMEVIKTLKNCKKMEKEDIDEIDEDEPILELFYGEKPDGEPGELSDEPFVGSPQEYFPNYDKDLTYSDAYKMWEQGETGKEKLRRLNIDETVLTEWEVHDGSVGTVDEKIVYPKLTLKEKGLIDKITSNGKFVINKDEKERRIRELYNRVPDPTWLILVATGLAGIITVILKSNWKAPSWNNKLGDKPRFVFKLWGGGNPLFDTKYPT